MENEFPFDSMRVVEDILDNAQFLIGVALQRPDEALDIMWRAERLLMQARHMYTRLLVKAATQTQKET